MKWVTENPGLKLIQNEITLNETVFLNLLCFDREEVSGHDFQLSILR